MTSQAKTDSHSTGRYHLHCSCGATIVTREKTATCANCGKTIVLQRVRVRRIRSLDPGPSTPWPPAAFAGDDRAPDINRRFKRFGFLILLLAAFAVFLLVLPDRTIQQWRASADTPEPTDCDWTSLPVGNKHCHYESRITRFKDTQGVEHTAVGWHRVNE
jgi:hypothetical protein